MTPKHTPGPWTAHMVPAPNADHFEAIVMVKNYGALGYFDKDSGKWHFRAADAHLVAAAPDLLDALRKFIEPFALTPDAVLREYPDVPQPVAILAARAAIAKAEGEAP